jgi:hypothetical protein
MKIPAWVIVGLLTLPLVAQDKPKRQGDDRGPKVGDEAPNFKAKVIGKDEHVELKKLVEKEKKPVVLIFGSYT